MSVGFSNRPDPPAPLDKVLWTMVKNGRRIVAISRVSSEVDGVEIRYMLNDQFLYSFRYHGPSLARLKPDLEAKRAEFVARGWIDG